ncbi:uncharacterized protein VP01_10917g1, partial [Puccinia sorghi]
VSTSVTIVESIPSLQAEHMTCERLTGLSELPVFINLAHPNQFILMKVGQVAMWGQAMVCSFFLGLMAHLMNQSLCYHPHNRLKTRMSPCTKLPSSHRST